MEQNRQSDQVPPTTVVTAGAESASAQANTGTADSHYYEQAIAHCNHALAAGSLSGAMLWARQAELLGAILEQNHAGMPEVTAAYAQIMLAACLRSQELALTTGNILDEHGKLGELISTASDRLNTRLGSVTEKQPRMVALMAQGFVHEHQYHLAQLLTANGSHYSQPSDLDQMLDRLAKIEQCAETLCACDQPFRPLDRKLTLAGTAVSNARYSITRFFTRFLSDWGKAEFYCKQAFMLLAAQSITDSSPLKPSGNQDLDQALSGFPAAYKALQQRHYGDSQAALKAVSEALNRATRS